MVILNFIEDKFRQLEVKDSTIKHYISDSYRKDLFFVDTKFFTLSSTSNHYRL